MAITLRRSIVLFPIAGTTPAPRALVHTFSDSEHGLDLVYSNCIPRCKWLAHIGSQLILAFARLVDGKAYQSVEQDLQLNDLQSFSCSFFYTAGCTQPDCDGVFAKPMAAAAGALHECTKCRFQADSEYLLFDAVSRHALFGGVRLETVLRVDHIEQHLFEH